MPTYQRLNIGYLLPGFCADENDWCIPVITNFIRTIAERTSVAVYTPHYPFERKDYSVHGIPVRCLSSGKQPGWKRPFLWHAVEKRIRDDHERSPFDLLHAFWGTETGFLATRIASKLSIPSIVTLAGGEFARFPREGYGSQLHPWQRYFINSSLQKADRITSGSDWLTKKVPGKYHDKLRTIPLGINTEMFRRGSLRTGKKLLAVGALIPIKNYPTMLRAVRTVQKTYPDITLNIAGYQDPSELERLQSLVNELGLSNTVTFLGDLQYDHMPNLYVSHDLLLHSSLYESQCMAILEGLARGMPAITSNVGIVPSLPDSLTYRFEPDNPDAMAAAILNSLSSPHHAHQAYEHGPRLIAENFNMKTIADRFINLYEESRSI